MCFLFNITLKQVIPKNSNIFKNYQIGYKYSNVPCVFCGFTWHAFIKELISQTVRHMAHLRFDPLKALKVAHKAKCCELRLHNQAKQYD